MSDQLSSNDDGVFAVGPKSGSESPQKAPEPLKSPPPTPVQSTSEKLKDRHLVTAITLPSRGLAYGDKMPGGQVYISSLSGAEEKMMTGKGGVAQDKLTILFNRTCDLGGVTPDELLSGDRFYLLIKLRSLSYGSKLTFPNRCPSCESQFEGHINLDTDMKVLSANDEWEEPFLVNLPLSGKTLSCRVLRGKDEREIEKVVKKKQQKNIHDEGNPAYSLALGRHITQIDGEDISPMGAAAFIEKMPVRDRGALTAAIEKMSPGLDRDIEVTCPHCGYEYEVVLPMSNDFFQVNLPE